MILLRKTTFVFKKIMAIFMAILIVIASSGFLNIRPAEAVGAAWYHANWAYRLPITIDHAKVPGDLVDFPVLVSVTATELTKAMTDGDGLVFTAGDGVTKLDHEIESFSIATGALIAWVKVPAISSSADTGIYLYYGYNSPNNEQNISGVWSNGFKMVQHFELPASLTDASSNATNGAETGGVTATPAVIGKGLHMDGVDDRVMVADNAALNFTNVLTASLWFKTDVTPDLSNGSENGILGKPNDFWTDSFGFYFDLTGKLRFFVNDYLSFAPAATVSATDWMHIVGVYDGSRVRLYVNGVEKNSVALNQAIGVNNKNLNIGRLSTNQYNTDGTFDEVRIANANRNASWIAAEYANQNSPATFVSVGGEENFEATKYLQITGGDSMVAGATQTITLTLRDGTGSVVTDFMGDKAVVLTGPLVAASGNQPTCTDKNNALVTLGVATTIAFANGVGVCNLTAYAAGNASVDASADGFVSTGDAGFDLDLTIIPASFNSFLVSAPASVVYDEAFTVVTTARDSFFNTVTTTPIDATIVPSSGTLSVTTIPVAELTDDGVATTNLTLTGTGVASPTTLTITSDGKAGSASLVVTGLPAVSSGGSSGGGNYSSGSGGPSDNGVGGPPPEVIIPVTSTLPTAPTMTPITPPPIPTVPLQPVAPPPVTQPIVRPPTPRPTTSIPSTPRPATTPPRVVPQNLTASFSRGKKAVPIIVERGADGKVRRKIVVTTDESLDLTIKLLDAAATVRGFLLPAAAADDSVGALIGEAGANAKYTFNYTDVDRDGVFSATIPTGVIGRDDRLITVVDYDDGLKPREVTEIIVTNLSGSVLDTKKQPVEKVFVTLLKEDSATGIFERWPAEDVGRPNPVLTTKSGHYYFAPPAGTYRLEVVKEGYENYVSESLQVADGQPINFDITLRTKTSLSGLSKGLLFLFTKFKELFYK